MRASSPRRVVISGIGLCTPFGIDRESSWRGLTSGRSAFRWLAAPHWTGDARLAGAPFSGGPCLANGSLDPIVGLALQTSREALVDAGLHRNRSFLENMGVVFGSSKGGLQTFAELWQTANAVTSLTMVPPEVVEPRRWLDVFPHQPAAEIARSMETMGPVVCPVAACATGLVACLRGADLIRHGDCDAVLVGSADASLQPAILGSFRRLGVLAADAGNPQIACRPFDLNRSGFAIGEGAACLVLESLESASTRGAAVYAEWVGGCSLSDPSGMTQLDPAGQSLQRLLSELWSIGGRIPDYLNLHGTGTRTNDAVECHAVRQVTRHRSSEFACSSWKGSIGHLLGAAGSVELAATALAIRDQVLPPTVNLLTPDPACRLQFTPKRTASAAINDAWKISLGFGGHLAGACLRRLHS